MSDWSILLLCFFSLSPGIAEEYSIASDSTEADGIRRITLESKYQPGSPLVRILTSKETAASGDDEKYFLYVLPVEAHEEHKYGDGMSEIVKIHPEQWKNLVVVEPSFAQLPWYADHATDPDKRQESYFLQVVLPAMEKLYPSKRPHRLLLGFSKSGFGAFALILRHSELFEAAAIFDAPLTKDKPNEFGMAGIFGTQENFEKYQVTKLLREHADSFMKTPRLCLAGYGNFRKHMDDAKALIESLGIQYVNLEAPQRKHVWESGWTPDAVNFLTHFMKQ